MFLADFEYCPKKIIASYNKMKKKGLTDHQNIIKKAILV